MRSAPRRVATQESVSQRLWPCRSLIAGCSQSIDLGRLALWSVLEFVHAAYRPRELNTWVDDLAHQERGRRQNVLEKVVQVAEALTNGLDDLGFKVSAKSLILAHPPRVAHDLVEILGKKGIKLQAATRGRDLGVDAHVGRRSTGVIKSRLTKAGKWAKAISSLVRVDRGARVLARTGFKPQAVWGLEAQGLAPTTLKRLRAQVAGMSGCRYPGGCATTAIRLAYDETAFFPIW